MKNETKMMWNLVARGVMGALAGAFIGELGVSAITRKKRVFDKILLAAGTVVTAWGVGCAIDNQMDKLLAIDSNNGGVVTDNELTVGEW